MEPDWLHSFICCSLRAKRRCLRMPPDRHPEPGVQVGEGSLTLGSSDAR